MACKHYPNLSGQIFCKYCDQETIHMHNLNFLPPVQYWWDHLTRKQQLFLLSQPIPASLYIYNATEEEKIKIWYEYSLNADLHSLSGWPETTMEDLRKV